MSIMLRRTDKERGGCIVFHVDTPALYNWSDVYSHNLRFLGAMDDASVLNLQWRK